MGRTYADGRRYAEDTRTPVPTSKAEIEKLLRDCGATKLVLGWDSVRGLDMIQCFIDDRMLRFDVVQPTEEEAYPLKVAQEERRRWRVQVMLVKAKLEAVRGGDSTIEHEFLANLVLPDGQTVGAWAGPQIATSYECGDMPLALLPGDVLEAETSEPGLAPRVRSRTRKG